MNAFLPCGNPFYLYKPAIIVNLTKYFEIHFMTPWGNEQTCPEMTRILHGAGAPGEYDGEISGFEPVGSDWQVSLLIVEAGSVPWPFVQLLMGGGRSTPSRAAPDAPRASQATRPRHAPVESLHLANPAPHSEASPTRLPPNIATTAQGFSFEGAFAAA